MFLPTWLVGSSFAYLDKTLFPNVCFNNFPAAPKPNSAPAPIANSPAAILTNSSGLLSCNPDIYSKPSSTPLPAVAPKPVPPETFAKSRRLIVLIPAIFGLIFPLVIILPAIEPAIGPAIPAKSAKSFQENPLSSITTFFLSFGIIPIVLKPSGVKAKLPLLSLVKPFEPTAFVKTFSFPPKVSIAPNLVLSQVASTPLS